MDECNPSNSMNDDSVSEFLSSETHDDYISDLVQREFPRWLFLRDEVSLEIDELTQKVRIKFWVALQKQHISNQRAYIRKMVSNGITDIIRHKRNLSLSLDEYGELCQGTILVAASEGMCDPAFEYEQKEGTIERVTQIVIVILTLPPTQRRAMLCVLKGLLDDVRPLRKVLRAYNVDIDAVNYPEGKFDAHKLQASLCHARKKLHCLLKSVRDEER